MKPGKVSKRQKTDLSSRNKSRTNDNRKHHARALVRHYPKSDFGKSSVSKKNPKRASRTNPVDVITKATEERRKKKARSQRKLLEKHPKSVVSSPSRIMQHNKIPMSQALHRRHRGKKTDKTSYHGKDNSGGNDSSSSAKDRRSEKSLKQKATYNNVSISASKSAGEFATSRDRLKKVGNRSHNQYKTRRDKNKGSSSLKNVVSGDDTTLSSSRPDRRKLKKEETHKNNLNKSYDSHKKKSVSHSAKTKVNSRGLTVAKWKEQSRRRKGTKGKKRQRKRTAGKMSESTSSLSAAEEKNVCVRKTAYEPLNGEVKDQRASKKHVPKNSSSSFRIASCRRKAADVRKPKKENEVEETELNCDGHARKIGRNSKRRYQNNKQKQHNQHRPHKKEYSGNKSPKIPMQTSSSSQKSCASSKDPPTESPSRKNFGGIATLPSVTKRRRKSEPTNEDEDALIRNKRRLKEMALKHERGGNNSSARWNEREHSTTKKRQISSVGVSSSSEDSLISSTRSRGPKKRSSKTLAPKISRRKGRRKDPSASGMPYNISMVSTSDSDNGTTTSSNVGSSKSSTASNDRRSSPSTAMVKPRSKRAERGKCNKARSSINDIEKNVSRRRKNSSIHFSSCSTTTTGSDHRKRYHRRTAYNHKSRLRSDTPSIEVEQKRTDLDHKRPASVSNRKASARKKAFQKKKTTCEDKHPEGLAQDLQSERGRTQPLQGRLIRLLALKFLIANKREIREPFKTSCLECEIFSENDLEKH